MRQNPGFHRVLRALAFFCGMTIGTSAVAHTFHGMSTRVIVGRERVTIMIGMINQDATVLAAKADLDADTILGQTELPAALDNLTSEIATRMRVTNNGDVLSPSVARVQVSSIDPLTSHPHELMATLLYTLPDNRVFQKLSINPNIFRDIPGLPLKYAAPPQGSQANLVTVFDCDAVAFETSGTLTYESVVGQCE